MNLGFFKNLENNLKNREVKKEINRFIEELSNNFTEKTKNKTMNIEDIEKEYKLTYDSSCSLISKRNEILQSYAKGLENEEKLYYISYKNDFNDTYKILEFNNIGEQDSFYLPKEELPKNISVDKVIKKVNNRCIIDEESTKEIIDKIEDSAKGIANKQNDELDKDREEDCLYQVVNLSLHGAYLQNKNNNVIFEEVNIPEDLKNVISNDYILRYKNGTYIFEEKLTDDFFDSLVEINKKK